jgi:regulator of sigma E protease
LPDVVSWIVPFLFVLTFVVTIHELGHYWAARAFNLVIDRFAIGFGRPILKWTDKRGVRWQIGWVPLGGYVRFAGDDNAASTVPDQADLDAMKAKILEHNEPAALQRFYHFAPVWQRAVISVAGPVANFVLAAVLFSLLLAIFGENSLPAVVGKVTPGSVAEQSGFHTGDVFKAMDGRKVADFQAVQQYVSMRPNDPIDFVIERAGRELAITATPIEATVEDAIAGRQKIGRLGFGPLGPWVHESYTPLQAVIEGPAKTARVLGLTIEYLGRLLTGRISPDQISGVIGIAKVSDGVAKASIEAADTVPQAAVNLFRGMLLVVALISVSVGFLNLLPIPVLDGGHLVFYAYEAVARRPLAANVQAVGYRLGLALLLGFMLFAVWNDLQRYNVFNFLGGLFS